MVSGHGRGDKGFQGLRLAGDDRCQRGIYTDVCMIACDCVRV